MRRLLPIILVVLISSGIVSAKDWRGILPLHSTRADVEALLGPPPPPPEGRAAYELNKSRSIYYLEEGEVFIVFATEDLLKMNDCQAVAEGTVLMIQVTPKDMQVSSLQLDEKTFKKFNASKTAGLELEGFVDEKEGLVIRAEKGKVQEIVYLASAVDRGRCSGYYAEPEKFVQLEIACWLPFDRYGKIRFSDEKARLDNFAIQLQNEEQMQGYIIVYAGRKATFGEAQLHANRAINYLIKVRGLDPQRVKAIDGGFREEFMVQLELAPPGAPPRVADPSVDPSQVELIYEKPRRAPKRKRP